MSEVISGVAKANGIDIGYDVRGEGEPLLLIAGFGMTRVMWDARFRDAIAARGFRVIRMDNRDTGASTRLKDAGVPRVPALFARSMLGLAISVPYRLEDMAADAASLMEGLGAPRFHVVGASMGGMIAQVLALDHASRIATMTSVMSTPGGRRYSFASLSALRELLTPLPRDPAAQVEHFVRLFRVIGGSGTPFDEPRARGLAEALTAAGPSASGSARQFAAILEGSNRRRARLPRIKAPTLVVHGSHDPLLPPRGSRAMARLIPSATLRIVDRMGHDFPTSEYEPLADAFAANARRASLNASISAR